VLRKLRDLVLDRFERAGDVRLQDEVEVRGLSLAHLFEDVLQADGCSLAPRKHLGLEAVRALVCELPGLPVVLDDAEGLTGIRNAVEAEDLDRLAGPGRI